MLFKPSRNVSQILSRMYLSFRASNRQPNYYCIDRRHTIFNLNNISKTNFDSKNAVAHNYDNITKKVVKVYRFYQHK